jgi:hemerythrin-like domain-containing protein
VIERVLTALERASSRLSKGEDVYLRFFTGTTVFIKNFADGCHHQKEEGILFPAMVENGLSKQTGPLAVMLVEHEEGRRLTQKMRQAIEHLQTRDDAGRNELVQNAMGYVKLLRQHIYKEDNILFPMADEVIPASHYAPIMDAFEHVEKIETGEGVHEKYEALAEWLKREIQTHTHKA